MLNYAGLERKRAVLEIAIRDAAFPAVFPHALEFNPPAHGTWNIVHIGMLVPQAQQIYVCAMNCMRGVILTAAEMNKADRFSFVILKEEDLLEGTVEDITIEGVIDVIRKLPERPPAVCLFTVCTHHFLGCDLRRIYRELETAFPEIDFIRGFMDPILQKEGPSPDQKLRKAMYQVLPELPAQPGTAAVIGGNVSLSPTSDLLWLLRNFGVTVRQVPEMTTYAEFQSLGSAKLFLGVVPNAEAAVAAVSHRLGRQGLYLPMSFSYEEIEDCLMAVMRWCEDSAEKEAAVHGYCQKQRIRCEERLEQLRIQLDGAPIVIDYTVHPRPLELTRLLLEHGFGVTKVYLNAVNPPEKETFSWLREHAPGVLLASTIQPGNRVGPRESREKTLALGQQAAWFTGTTYFVNMVEGGDLWGFDGIGRLADLMAEAWETPKDARDLLPRKGLGCESCF